MKKILSFVLALAMTATLLCSTAFADEPRVGKDKPDQTNTVEVQIKLNPGSIVNKYCIDIEYPDPLVFTYSEKSGTWDPEDYDYVDGQAAGWSGNGDIKITNHSDMPVKYVVTSKDVVNTYGNLTVTIDNGTGIIDGCTPLTAENSQNATAVIGIAGTPSGLTSTPVTLGYVQIVISKP